MTYQIFTQDHTHTFIAMAQGALLSGLAAGLLQAQAQGLDAGTQVAGASIDIAYDAGSQTGVALSDNFPGFVVDRLLTLWVGSSDVTGVMPGDTFVAGFGIDAQYDNNDTVSFRLDLTDASLALENLTLTYDDANGYADLVPNGPVVIDFSPHGTDISSSPTGFVTIDTPPDHALWFELSATMPASATVGDVVTQHIWMEPLIAATALSGTANPDAYSLLNVDAVNTLDGVETWLQLDSASVATDPVTGAAAREHSVTVSIPELRVMGGGGTRATVGLSDCATGSKAALQAAAISDYLPGTCESMVWTVRNWGFSPTESFDFTLPVSPHLHVLNAWVNSDFLSPDHNGLVDGPDPGTGPVVIIEDGTGNPCTADTIDCVIRIEDASLLPQANTAVEVRVVLK